MTTLGRASGFALACVAAGFIGCDDGDGGGGGAGGGAGGAGGGGGVTCPAGTTTEGSVCVLQGEITQDLTLTADKTWLLRGGVFIGDDTDRTVLTVEAGTTVYGETATKGMLVIRRGSQIQASGTASAPIVFTSPNTEGSRARGDWGGLIINGRAPINGCDAAPCESEGEGGTGLYGGADPDDDSGTLRYVRVEYAGILLSEDNELNGIAFQGVGRGTTVDYVQVHMNKDDGIEFFGGTVDARHLLLTGIGDDCLDWTDGWQGRVQFVAAVQFEDAGDQGIEADNNGESNDVLPRSAPTLSNLTIWGSGSANSDLGMLLREGTGAFISNAIVGNFGEACFTIDHASTFANGWDEAAMGLSGALVVQNSLFWCPGSATVKEAEIEGLPFTVEEFLLTLNSGNEVVDPALTGVPDLRPTAGSPALTGATGPADPFFEATDYRGAFGDTDWTAGWTNWDPS
ncbi:MAG: hypothetical protein R3F60_05935 [bacterium]